MRAACRHYGLVRRKAQVVKASSEFLKRNEFWLLTAPMTFTSSGTGGTMSVSPSSN